MKIIITNDRDEVAAEWYVPSSREEGGVSFRHVAKAIANNLAFPVYRDHHHFINFQKKVAKDGGK